MEEFNLGNDFEIGTSISKIKNKNNENNDVINLIKDLEERLDNIENNNHIPEEEPILLNSSSNNENKKKNSNSNKRKSNIMMKYKDIVIYMIFFILLNNKFVIEFIYKFPYISTINSPYPNLIIRTLIFGVLAFLYKKYFK